MCNVNFQDSFLNKQLVQIYADFVECFSSGLFLSPWIMLIECFLMAIEWHCLEIVKYWESLSTKTFFAAFNLVWSACIIIPLIFSHIFFNSPLRWKETSWPFKSHRKFLTHFFFKVSKIAVGRVTNSEVNDFHHNSFYNPKSTQGLCIPLNSCK